MAVSVVKIYLVVYNIIQLFGWSAILALLVNHYLSHKSVDSVWLSVGPALFAFQNAAVLEVVHAAFGFVRSPVLTTFIQVLSRVGLTLVATYIPIARESIFFSLMVGSWSVTEVVRYGYYALSQLTTNVPPLLVWLRYSLFLVLYPSGVVGEMGTLYSSLPYFAQHRPFSLFLPNPLNFAFDSYYAVWVVLATYLPGLPFMYGYMMGQRRKYVGHSGKTSSRSFADGSTADAAVRAPDASPPRLRQRPKRTDD